MKILMTADPIGGVWRYTLELCTALQPYGVSVALATLGAALSAEQRREVSGLANVMLHESDYRLEWMASPWESLAEAGDWLLGLEREFAPDLIHLNHLVHADLNWRAPVLVVGHSCVLSWLASVGGRLTDEWQRYREHVAQSLRAARLVVAPTERMMRNLHEHYGALAHTRVIANGADPRHFRVEHKESFILSAGRLWDEGKNVAALDKIASEVRWPIFVAGSAVSPDGRVRTLKGVRPLGMLSPRDLTAWYAAASIYALPARYEPFGLTALEAASCGCALVLGDIESLREVWGAAARYVPPNDPQALRDVLNDLIDNREELQMLALMARIRARRYTARQMASGYWSAYRSVLETKETSPCVSYSSITH
jgi:glycosyltransferase involved in cell wall biosynthesis